MGDQPSASRWPSRKLYKLRRHTSPDLGGIATRAGASDDQGSAISTDQKWPALTQAARLTPLDQSMCPKILPAPSPLSGVMWSSQCESNTAPPTSTWIS